MDRNSDAFKRGIDIILKSDRYTDEYKQVLLAQLGTDYSAPETENSTQDVDFDLLKSGSLVISRSSNAENLITITEKPAAVSGYLEKPNYIEEELTKAVDVEVDELINLPPKQKPLTVPKETYDDLTDLYNQSINDLEDLRKQLNEAIADLETANLNINLLNQTVDTERLLRAAADNQAQASFDRYTAVLLDFQRAIQKAIQEAIERVSLTAQVRGLQAQKEVLKVLVQNLQQSLQTSQEQILAAQFTSGQPGFFENTNESGWKSPDSSISSPSAEPIYLRHTKVVNGMEIDFYNLTEEILIFTFEYIKGRREDIKGYNGVWLGGPQRVEVGPREGTNPGKSTVTFEQTRVLKNKRRHRGYGWDEIQVTVSNGDSYTINGLVRARSRDA